MKRLLYLVFVAIFSTGFLIDPVGKDNSGKTEKRPGQYEEILELVEKGNFIFRARRAFPQGGRSIELTGNRGFLEVSDSIAEAGLPFFGRAYHVRYPGYGGIKFSGEMENPGLSENTGKMRINYSFKVRDYDMYRVNMVISYNGSTTLDISSNHRSHISYYGNVIPADN